MAEGTGIFEGLFDTSFSKFVSSTVIRYLYILVQAINVVGAGIIVAAGFSAGVGQGILAFVCAALLLVIFCILTRIWAELLIVIFRIAENTRKIAENSRQEGAS